MAQFYARNIGNGTRHWVRPQCIITAKHTTRKDVSRKLQHSRVVQIVAAWLQEMEREWKNEEEMEREGGNGEEMEW